MFNCCVCLEMLSSCTAGSSSHELRSDMLDCYGSVYFARRLQKLVEVGEVGLSRIYRGVMSVTGSLSHDLYLTKKAMWRHKTGFYGQRSRV